MDAFPSRAEIVVYVESDRLVQILCDKPVSSAPCQAHYSHRLTVLRHSELIASPTLEISRRLGDDKGRRMP
jgi:hypothetical protein